MANTIANTPQAAPDDVVEVGSVQSSTASADNLAATVTIAAPPVGKAHYLYGLAASFTAAATKLLTVKDGATVKENLVVVDSVNDNRLKALKVTGALEVSLAASGTLGNVGYVTVRYETR
jgi:hypothetical protein